MAESGRPYAGIYFGAGAGKPPRLSEGGRFRQHLRGQHHTTNETRGGLFAGGMTGSMVDLFLGYNWRTGNFVAGVSGGGNAVQRCRLKAGPEHAGTTTVSTTNGVADPTTSTSGPARQPATALDRRPDRPRRFSRHAQHVAVRPGRRRTRALRLSARQDDFGGKQQQMGPGLYGGRRRRAADHRPVVAARRISLPAFRRRPQRDHRLRPGRCDHGRIAEDTTNTARRTAADFHIGKIGVVYKFGGGGPASAMAAMPSSLASTWADGWAGPYFGAYVGAGAGVARGNYAGFFDGTTFGTITQNALLAGTITGMQTDLFAGYNLRSDRFVVGGQVEVTQFSDVAAKMAGTQTSVDSTSLQTSILDQSERLRSMVGVVGRAGFLATPNLLLYGLGGLALGHFKYPDGGDRFPIRTANGWPAIPSALAAN